MSSVYAFKQIESDNLDGAAAVSVVLLFVALIVLLRDRGRARTLARLAPPAFVALGYLAVLLIVPVGVVFYRTFENGVGAVWDSITTPAAISAFWLTIEVTLDRRAAQRDLRRLRRDRARARAASRASASSTR